MSDVVGTGTDTLCRGEDRPRGVEVPISGVTADRALECPDTQPEAFRGSRSALGAGHRGVGGRHQHHLPARPHTPVDQLTFTGPDSGVGRLTSRGGSGQELRLEVLDRDQVVAGDHPGGPLAGVVGVLPGGFLLDLGCLPLRVQVALRRGRALRSPPAGHPALGLGPFGGAAFTVAQVRQVKRGVGGGRGGLHTPVDADGRAVRNGRHDGVASDDERRIPVPEVVAVHPHTGRSRRQIPRPHHRDGDLTRQAQQPGLDTEASGRVLQARQRGLELLGLRPAAALQSERGVQGSRVGAQCLRLGDLRALAKPGVSAASLGQQLGQLAQGRLTAGLLLVDGFVPQPPATAPFGEQGGLRGAAGPQAVGVAHRLGHTIHDLSARGYAVESWARVRSDTTSLCTDVTTISSSTASTGATSSTARSTSAQRLTGRTG